MGRPAPSLQKYFVIFDSKTDHLSWAYVSRQLLCDDFSCSLLDDSMYHEFSFKFLQFFMTDALFSS